MKEFEFEPASTVLDICRMYVELGANERFCAAVSDDGRSYSPQLFTLAEAVLGTYCTVLHTDPSCSIAVKSNASRPITYNKT